MSDRRTILNSSGTIINPSREETLVKLVQFGITQYDYIALTYVASGNGAGKIETVTYKSGGSGGTTLATLTLGYDGSNRLSTITKT